MELDRFESDIGGHRLDFVILLSASYDLTCEVMHVYMYQPETKSYSLMCDPLYKKPKMRWHKPTKRFQIKIAKKW